MYRIKVLLFIAFIAFTSSVTAQPELKIYGAAPGFYLKHKVESKETWYSIGRLYNLSPKEITLFNHATVDDILQIGQVLEIPLISYNFSQDGVREMDEVFVPVYYVVQEKEWLYRVSQNNNKVPVETLEKWNNITNNDVRPGMKLVVGFLKVKQSHSALAKGGTKRVTVAAPPPIVKNEPVQEVNKEPVQETRTAQTITRPVRKAEKREEVTMTSNTTDPEEKEQPKETEAAPAVQTAEQTSYAGYNGGFFRNAYSGNGKNVTGNAGVFRSTSGWKDGKYYALMNSVPVGTIIKVTFPSTRKSVYVKVLGQLPDMKESAGLAIRISDAAAAELGVELGKFYVDVKY